MFKQQCLDKGGMFLQHTYASVKASYGVPLWFPGKRKHPSKLRLAATNLTKFWGYMWTY